MKPGKEDMDIELSADTGQKVEKVAQLFGINQQQVVDRALLLYLDNISKYLDLKQEITEWDMLSDEALMNFEQSL